MSIAEIAGELYSTSPTLVLWHYTSLNGIQGIVESGSLYATHARFLNDSAELKHAQMLLTYQIDQRARTRPQAAEMLSQLKEWLAYRMCTGGMLFLTSFSEKGNLLSQWRGYCPSGKGVSIGFNPADLKLSATEQGFSVGRCIYLRDEQTRIVDQILDAIENLAVELGEEKDPAKRHSSQSFHGVFELIEDDLLRIACLLKDPSFSEESEWRVVSQVISNYAETPIEYREGASMLIPFLRFRLLTGSDGRVYFHETILGPNPNPELSFNSLSMFLGKYCSHADLRVSTSEIPFRSW